MGKNKPTSNEKANQSNPKYQKNEKPQKHARSDGFETVPYRKNHPVQATKSTQAVSPTRQEPVQKKNEPDEIRRSAPDVPPSGSFDSTVWNTSKPLNEKSWADYDDDEDGIF